MSLPIDEILPQLLRTLRSSACAVLQAPPGAGKTTRVPLALLDESWLRGRRLIMLEPRRLAARSAARYMAGLLRESVGETVGYRVRLDSRVGPGTRIEVVTEGVLTRLLQDDPALESYAAVLFDEFHERSLQADLGLALALESQQALRPDLRLLVMSATLEAAPVAQLLGGAPLLSSAGRSYPVELRYRAAGAEPWERHLLSVLREVLREEDGSVLVFLPGVAEIRRLAAALASNVPPDVDLAPLYGDLAPAAQDAAIAPAPPGRRKLVLATSIAETSLTIEGVRVVVDSGWGRRPRFDPVSGMTRLVTQRISQAAAEQRRGRAGRTQPGVCYRLWSESEQTSLAAHIPAEMLEADLSALVLELAQWGARDPAQLAWLDPPPAAAWAQGRALLQSLGALEADGRISGHGQAMRELGLEPRLAHMILKGRELGWGRMAAELAALLSERDVFTGASARSSDLAERLEVLRGRHERAELARGRLARVREVARRWQRRDEPARTEEPDTAGVLLAFAYPDRVAQRRPGGAPRYRLANGRGAALDDADPLRDAPFLVAAALDGVAREARIFQAAALSRAALEHHFGARMCRHEAVVWDAAAGAVSARRQLRLGELLLEERPLAQPASEAVQAAMAEGLRQAGLDVLPWDESLRQWRARVALMRRLDGDTWPDLSDHALRQRLQEWFEPYAAGITRLAQLRQFPLRDALESLLSYAQRRELDAQAPTHYRVPSGSNIALNYAAGELPVLAVKLQEMFGAQRTPAVANDRVPLLVHLLSPARRPVQVTQDLVGFWQGSYHEVRKDLRGRYPKHPWPEDPLTAPPTRHTKRRNES